MNRIFRLLPLLAFSPACFVDDEETLWVRCPPGQHLEGTRCVDDRPDGCLCPEYYQPVCGEDGLTYSNVCFAGCAGVGVAREGRCGIDPCLCPPIYNPLCGVDGLTYGNECEARCARVEAAHPGPCDEACNILCFAYQPVCGTDGITYDCPPIPDCLGVPIAHEGECRDLPPGCEWCDEGWVPVCGTDNRTYDNACLAECRGIPAAYPGECGGGGCREPMHCEGQGLVHPMCVGEWACVAQQCVWDCRHRP